MSGGRNRDGGGGELFEVEAEGVAAEDAAPGKGPAARRARRAARRAALAAEAAAAAGTPAAEVVAPAGPGEARAEGAAAPVAGEALPESATPAAPAEIVAPRDRAAARKARRKRRKARVGKARALRGRRGEGEARGGGREGRRGELAPSGGGALPAGAAGASPAVVGAAPRPALEAAQPAQDGLKRARRRALVSRVLVWGSFLLMVAAPSGVAGWYLWTKAADQYASEVAFAVRSLDGGPLPSPVMDIFGGGGDATTGDSQMLFEYLRSQPLVTRIDARLDLRGLYNRPEADPVFALGEATNIEELVDYWNRAVAVSYDTTAGIIDVEVRAFRAGDATAVAEAIVDEAETLVNGLSTGARADAVRFAEIDLVEAEERVREARLALQTFREAQGTADVAGDITQEMTLIAQLRAQRAGLQADIDSRRGVLAEGSPVLSALERRLASLDAQIAEAEGRIADGSGGAGAPAAGAGGPATRRETLAEAAGVQERLQVELEFATNMYTSAQAALETARAEARRAQRYLATHIAPTLAEEPRYPDRLLWTAAIFGVSFLIWAILLLIVGSIRDRS